MWPSENSIKNILQTIITGLDKPLERTLTISTQRTSLGSQAIGTRKQNMQGLARALGFYYLEAPA